MCTCKTHSIPRGYYRLAPYRCVDSLVTSFSLSPIHGRDESEFHLGGLTQGGMSFPCRHGIPPKPLLCNPNEQPLSTVTFQPFN